MTVILHIYREALTKESRSAVFEDQDSELWAAPLNAGGTVSWSDFGEVDPWVLEEELLQDAHDSLDEAYSSRSDIVRTITVDLKSGDVIAEPATAPEPATC